MKLEFDPAKNAKNIAERGLAFEDVVHLNWETAIYRHDDRKDYGEERIRALVRDHGGALHQVTFTMRDDGQVMRVISFRLARDKERQRYEKET
jgi:uncharacterized DUF497 family protein